MTSQDAENTTTNTSENGSNEEMFQTVIVELSNGDTGAFTGKVLAPENLEGVTIVGISFLPPAPLPDGCAFEAVLEEDREDFNPEDLPEVVTEESEIT